MRRRRLAVAAMLTVLAVAGCTEPATTVQTPSLQARGTVLTTVKATRQDLTNRISLGGKVAINPVFGLAAPADGEVRYLKREPATRPVTRPTWVATVWEGREQHRITIPTGATLAGWLMRDRATVTAGMPVVSATLSGYGIVADIDSAQAYRISGALQSVQGQIKNGPGPFPCTALGTIAALPAGTLPAPPESTPAPTATGAPGDGPGGPLRREAPQPGAPQPEAPQPEAPPVDASEATGLRLVCTPPDDVKLINGAAVTLDVVTDEATDVLVLPVEAVAGTQGSGKVDVVGPDRTRTTVDVTLGLTDGKMVEITDGLTGDETVAIPGPNLPTAAPAPEGAEGPSGAPK